MVGYIDKRYIGYRVLQKDKNIIKIWEEKELNYFFLNIKLKLNCVIGIPNEQKKILNDILSGAYKEIKGIK